MKCRVGSAARKLVLVALANYADDHSLAWPSQKRLSRETEQSVDTVQRHLRRLADDGFINIWIRRRFGGHWPSRTYKLNMPTDDATAPRAANCGTAEPHSCAARPSRTAMRNDKSIEHPLEPLDGNRRQTGTSAPKVAKRSLAEIQNLQRRVVLKLGNGDEMAGWLVFGELPPHQRRFLEILEADGSLDDRAILATRDAEALAREKARP